MDEDRIITYRAEAAVNYAGYAADTGLVDWAKEAECWASLASADLDKEKLPIWHGLLE